MWLTFMQYVLPALIAVIAGIVTAGIAAKSQAKKNSTDDSIALRQCLMEERKGLVKEIADLRKSVDALEAENQKQAEEMAALREKNRQLIAEIKHFGSGLDE